MKRRRFLAGAGLLAGAGSFAVGTGAFTSLSADRAVSVAVSDDDRAFLRLEPIVDKGRDSSPTRRSFTSGAEVAFNIPGNGDGENANAEGMGLSSVYEFHELVRVENQGTQSVEVYSEYSGDYLDNLALVVDNGILRDIRPTIGVGEYLDVGLYIDTPDSGTGEYDETLTIVAEATDS